MRIRRRVGPRTFLLSRPYWLVGEELWTARARNAVGRCFVIRDGLPVNGRINLKVYLERRTVAELITLTEPELLMTRGAGPGVVSIVKAALATAGLSLAEERT